nr:hypothetical protein [uncultured Bdellovibrio sp.]
MKNLLIPFLFLTPLNVFAQSILLQAPGASAGSYQEFLKSHKEVISYVEHTQSHLSKNEAQEAQLFQLGDSFNQDITSTITQLKKIQNEGPLTLLSLRYVRDLTEKSLNLKTTTQERQELLHFYCKSVALLSEGPVLFPCPTQFTSLQKLAKKYPNLEKVFIESQGFSAEETVPLSPKTAYQWTLVSNSQSPVSFFGTYEQLLNQQFAFEYLAEGTCDGFSTKDLDLELMNRGVIYFSNECTPRIQSNEKKKSWVAEHKPWLYTAGALVLGGIIYSMKDKKMVINTSSLK